AIGLHRFVDDIDRAQHLDTGGRTKLSQDARVESIRLAATRRDQPQGPRVQHEHYVTHRPQQAGYPQRMSARLEHDAAPRCVAKLPRQRLSSRAYSALADNLAAHPAKAPARIAVAEIQPHNFHLLAATLRHGQSPFLGREPQCRPNGTAPRRLAPSSHLSPVLRRAPRRHDSNLDGSPRFSGLRRGRGQVRRLRRRHDAYALPATPSPAIAAAFVHTSPHAAVKSTKRSSRGKAGTASERARRAHSDAADSQGTGIHERARRPRGCVGAVWRAGATPSEIVYLSPVLRRAPRRHDPTWTARRASAACAGAVSGTKTATAA